MCRALDMESSQNVESCSVALPSEWKQFHLLLKTIHVGGKDVQRDVPQFRPRPCLPKDTTALHVSPISRHQMTLSRHSAGIIFGNIENLGYP